MKKLKLMIFILIFGSIGTYAADNATKQESPLTVVGNSGEKSPVDLTDAEVEMHGDPNLSAEAKALLSRIKKVQDEIETAYAATRAMGPEATRMVLAATDSAQALFREVILMPVSETGFTKAEQGRVFEEIFRGHRDLVNVRNRGYGSLQNLFYATIARPGVDPVASFDGKVTPFGAFSRSFREVFYDLRAASLFKKDINGKWVWGIKEIKFRERTVRNMIVRLFDFNEFANKNLSDDELYAYLSDEGIGLAVETAAQLRNERRSAEKIATYFYGGMLAGNLFIAPMLLPIPFINWDFVGYLTHHIWGASFFSGAFFFLIYARLVQYKYYTRTQRTFDLLKDLWRVVTDPVKAAAELKKGHEMNEQEEEAAKAGYKQFVQSIREGKGPLGEHRAKMLANGYDPLNLNDLSDCNKALAQAPY